MSDWPLIIFLICGGSLILIIGLMHITDLDSFFAALAVIIDWISGLPGMAMNWIESLFTDTIEVPPAPPKKAL